MSGVASPRVSTREAAARAYVGAVDLEIPIGHHLPSSADRSPTRAGVGFLLQLAYSLYVRYGAGVRKPTAPEQAGTVAIWMQQNSFRRKFEDHVRPDPKNADRRRKGYTAVAAKMARVAYAVVTTG